MRKYYPVGKRINSEFYEEAIHRLSKDMQFIAKEIPRKDLSIPCRYGLLRSDDWGAFFHEIAYSVNILDCAGEIEIPLLLFRGENDEVMDVNKTNELYERLNKKIP